MAPQERPTAKEIVDELESVRRRHRKSERVKDDPGGRASKQVQDVLRAEEKAERQFERESEKWGEGATTVLQSEATSPRPIVSKADRLWVTR